MFGIGGTNDDSGVSVGLDSATNVYVDGWFRGTVNFDPGLGTNNLASNGTGGAGDAFLAKYDASGHLVWANGFGGSVTGQSNVSMAAGMTLDTRDNVYMTGLYYGSADFDPSTNSVTLTNAGSSDIFLTKYTPSGTIAASELFDLSASTNGFRFTAGCCDVLASGDLMMWTNILHVAPATGVVQVLDARPAASTSQFYRAKASK